MVRAPQHGRQKTHLKQQQQTTTTTTTSGHRCFIYGAATTTQEWASVLQQWSSNHSQQRRRNKSASTTLQIDPPAVLPVAILRSSILRAFSSTSRFGFSFTLLYRRGHRCFINGAATTQQQRRRKPSVCKTQDIDHTAHWVFPYLVVQFGTDYWQFLWPLGSTKYQLCCPFFLFFFLFLFYISTIHIQSNNI
jgi:hypothetical protein